MIKKLLFSLLLCSAACGQFWNNPAQKPWLGKQIDWGHPLARDLVGCWLMNEGGGDKVQDLSGNGKHGTGSLIWTPGKSGPALEMTGAAGNVDTQFDCSPYNEFTIITSVKTDSIVGTYYIADQSDGSVGFGLRIVDEKLSFFCYSGGDAGHFYSNYSLVVGQWVQFACVHSANNTIYINGVYDNTTASALGIDDSSDTMRIGSEFDGDTHWDGLIEYLMIWNRALSVSEIAEHYQNPFCMFEPVFPVWWFGGIGAPPAGGGQFIMISN